MIPIYIKNLYFMQAFIKQSLKSTVVNWTWRIISNYVYSPFNSELQDVRD